MLNKLLLAVAVAVVMTVSAMAQDGPFVPYSEALAKCSAEWKVSETRRDTPKGKGVEAWNNFRRNCVTEKGYVKGRKAPTQTAG